MRDRTFYAGLIPVGAVAFGVAFATMRPAAIDNTSHAEIVAVVTVNAPEVVIQYPTATTTPTVTPTETPWPTDVPLPTWGGQQGDGLYVIPAVTATPKPPATEITSKSRDTHMKPASRHATVRSLRGQRDLRMNAARTKGSATVRRITTRWARP